MENTWTYWYQEYLRGEYIKKIPIPHQEIGIQKD
jgi:hypothetical protein